MTSKLVGGFFIGGFAIYRPTNQQLEIIDTRPGVFDREYLCRHFDGAEHYWLFGFMLRPIE